MIEHKPAASEGGKGTPTGMCDMSRNEALGIGPHPQHAHCKNWTPVASVEGQRTGDDVAILGCACSPGRKCDLHKEVMPNESRDRLTAQAVTGDQPSGERAGESSVPGVEGMGAREMWQLWSDEGPIRAGHKVGFPATYSICVDEQNSNHKCIAMTFGETGEEAFALASAIVESHARSLRGAGGERELERAREARKHTQDWYARHYGKVEDWARKILPEPWRTQFFNCVANGTYDHTKDVGEPYMSVGAGMITPSGYFRMDSAAEQLMRDQTERAEASESREQALTDEVKQFRAWKESMMAVTPDMQEIGKIIGVKCGDSVHDKIIPWLRAAASREQTMRENLKVSHNVLRTELGRKCDIHREDGLCEICRQQASS